MSGLGSYERNETGDYFRIQIDPRDLLRRRVKAWTLFIVQVSWAFFLLFTFLLKPIEAGFAPTASHFTNWAWGLQGFFIAATAGAPFLSTGLIDPDTRLGRFTHFILFAFYVPLLGVIFTVAALVVLLLATNSPFLLDFFMQLPAAIVILGNDVYHVFPIISFGIYTFFFHKDIYYAHNRVLVRHGIFNRPLVLLAYILYQAYLGTGVILGIYAALYNPFVIYETDLPLFWGIVAVFTTLTLINLGFLLFMLFLEGVGVPIAYTRAWYWRNDSSPLLNGGVLVIPVDDRGRAK